MAPKRGKRQVDLTGVENCIRTSTRCAESLLRATRSLPEVDEEGNSECPFAKDLYAKKEKLQQEVQGLLKKLHKSEDDIEWLIESIKQDLTVVSAHEDQINSDRARDHFSEAEAKLAAQYKKYLKLRDRIEETIKILDEALREADTMHYPGMTPASTPETEVSPPLIEHDEPHGADKEIQALFELDRRSRIARSDDSDANF